MSTRERGPLLTVWLMLLLGANAGTALLYSLIVFSPTGSLFLESVPVWAVYVFISGGVFNSICGCLLFLWRKWGFYGLCISAAVALGVNLYKGVCAYAIIGVAGAVATYLVLRTKWAYFQ